MKEWLRDVRRLLRSHRKSPAFAIAVIAIIALGTGTATAVFTIVHSVLIQPLPYPAPDELVHLWEVDSSTPADLRMTSISNLRDWQEQTRLLAGIAAWQRPASVTLTGTNPVREIKATIVTSNFFEVLQIPAVLGRTFLDSEGVAGNHRVAVISSGLWKTEYGQLRNVTGKTIELDQESYTVVGVAPERFKSPAGEADVWIPITMSVNEIDRGQNYLQTIGRMKKGVTIEQLESELSSIASTLEAKYPATNKNRKIAVFTMQKQVSGSLSSSLWMLAGAVGLVLLISCFNSANLLVIRGTVKRHQYAIQMALGASKSKIIQEIILDAVALYSAGALIGLVLAYWILQISLQLEPGTLPQFNEITLNFQAILFSLGLCLIAAPVCAIVPILHLDDTNLPEDLKSGSRTSAGGKGWNFRKTLAGAQIAICFILAVAAALLVQSFSAIRNQPPGFDPEHVYVMQQALDGEKYENPADKNLYYRNLIESVHQIPGVKSAAAATVIPMGNFGIDFEVPYYLPSQPQPEISTASRSYFRAVTPGFFSTMRIPLLKGRDISVRDTADTPLIVIINEALARKIYPNGDAVGKQLKFFWADWQTYEIVGVAANTRSYGLTAGVVPELYVPDSQIPYGIMNVIIRFEKEIPSASEMIRAAVEKVDPIQPVQDLTTLNELTSDSIRRERFAAALLSAFSITGLILAFAGIYGTISYNTMSRTREIGLRIAIGATREQIRNGVMKDALRILVPGLLAGGLLSIAVMKIIQGLLFSINPFDLFTFLAIAALITFSVLLASSIPAAKAASIDPLDALRNE